MYIKDDIIKNLGLQKNGDKFNDFVIDDAIFNIKKAQETLEDGLKNPEQWFKNSEFNAITFLKAFPFIYFIQQQQLLYHDS